MKQYLSKIELKIKEFTKRRRIHVLLQFFSILLLLLLILMLYNETYNEYKLSKIRENKETINAFHTNENIVLTKISDVKNKFQDYLQIQNDTNLNNYLLSIDSLKSSINELEMNLKSDELFNKNSNVKNTLLKVLTDEKKNIENIFENQDNKKFKKHDLSGNLNPFDYNDVLKSLDVKSSVEIDTVKRKGFLGRIGDAITGDVDVQKEKYKVLITMKFGKNISTGGVEEQFKRVFMNTNSHYSSEFSKIMKGLTKNELMYQEFLDNNSKLLFHGNKIVENLNQTLNSLEKEIVEDYNNQYDTNRLIRIIVMSLIALSLIACSIFLFFLTKLTYEYQDSLKESQEKILNNLNFKNRIVSMISHEIKSPLHSVTIYLNEAFKKIEDSKIKKLLGAVLNTTDSMTLMINQILDYSKSESKKMKLSNTKFNLKEEINNVCTNLESILEKNNNKLIIKNNLDYEQYVNSDKLKIQQLLYNLVGNANKFTNNGSVFLEFNSIELEDEIKFKFSVQDNGIGIDQEDLKYIFQDYYQGDVPLNNVNNLGLGLGLSLCKEIVDLFNGEIEIESIKNKGTLVKCELKLKK